MATIKSYTDIEQSKKLAEILPLESADMWWAWYSSPFDNGHYDDFPMFYKPICNLDESVPCWSLTALLDILDYPQLSKDKLGSGKEGWMVSVYPNDCRYDSCWHSNPVNACYEMIIKLHELKMLQL